VGRVYEYLYLLWVKKDEEARKGGKSSKSFAGKRIENGEELNHQNANLKSREGQGKKRKIKKSFKRGGGQLSKDSHSVHETGRTILKVGRRPSKEIKKGTGKKKPLRSGECSEFSLVLYDQTERDIMKRKGMKNLKSDTVTL